MPDIIDDICTNDLKKMIDNLDKDKIIILRFTATWCGPCKGIDGICSNYFNVCNSNIQPIVIDVDETIELFMQYKRSKMLKGIPALYAYYGSNKQDPWYVPNDSVNTGDQKQVIEFFNRCSTHINNQK